MARVPSANAIWSRLRAAGLSSHRLVGDGWRTVRVIRATEYGVKVFASSAEDYAAVRAALDSFGLPVSEIDCPYGEAHGGRDHHLHCAAEAKLWAPSLVRCPATSRR